MEYRKISMARALKNIAKDRERTNILRVQEQQLIAYLVQRVPAWISSDGLTAIGLFGNLLVASSLVLASFVHRGFLFLTLAGFIINWVGDSLDGRLAYYRNRPRKWYGFTLDITVDWIGTIFIGLGYILYAQGAWKLAGYFFVVMFGWEMITSQLRYTVTGKYSIDSGVVGPTEMRIILAFIFVLEFFIPGSIHYVAILACLFLLISNIIDSRKLIMMADARDKEEKKAKLAKEEELRLQHKENA